MVERGGLENRYSACGIEGSNPSLSAQALTVSEGADIPNPVYLVIFIEGKFLRENLGSSLKL